MQTCNVELLSDEVDEIKQSVFEICQEFPDISLSADDLKILETGSWCSWQPTYYPPQGIALDLTDAKTERIIVMIKDFVYDKLKGEFDAYKAQFEGSMAFNYVSQTAYYDQWEAYAGTMNASYAQLSKNLYAQSSEIQTAIANMDYAMATRITETEANFQGSLLASTALIQQSYASLDETVARLGGFAWVDTPSGQVLTGFSAEASSATGSQFAIFADRFYIASGATTSDGGMTVNAMYKPFSIANGVVTFAGQATDPTARTSASTALNNAALSYDKAVQAEILAQNAALVASGKATLSEMQQWVINANYVLANDVAAAINNNKTTINGSKITTGSIYADKLAANAIYGQQMLIDSANNPRATTANGGTLGLFNSQNGQNFNALAGVNYNTSNTGNGIQGEHKGSGVGMRGVSTNGVGVNGDTFNGAGEWGFFTAYKCRAASFSPFTGSHIAYTQDTSLQVGQLVYSIDAWTVDVSQTLVHVAKTTTPKDKRVFGVVNYIKHTLMDNIEKDVTLCNKTINEETGEEVFTIKPEYQPYVQYMQDNDFVEVSVNALGEGGMLVCSDNGDISNGDYLCSAIMGGYAMKQEDDLLHSYTVGKALESVVWANEPSNTKMIAVTYHCG